MYPAKWFFRKHEAGADDRSRDPAVARRRICTSCCRRRSISATQTASLQIVVNPLVNWIWLGFGVLAFGTGIALLPERAFSFALAKLPASEAPTTAALTCCWRSLLGGSTLCRRRMTGSRQHADVVLRAQRRSRSRCSTRSSARAGCGHTTIAECRKDPCETSASDARRAARRSSTRGRPTTRSSSAFITNYGSEEMLGAPIDKGFNRLAWFLPWALGAGGAVLVGFAAVKWSEARFGHGRDRGRRRPGHRRTSGR